jgi:HEAT repeat protein
VERTGSEVELSGLAASIDELFRHLKGKGTTSEAVVSTAAEAKVDPSVLPADDVFNLVIPILDSAAEAPPTQREASPVLAFEGAAFEVVPAAESAALQLPESEPDPEVVDPRPELVMTLTPAPEPIEPMPSADVAAWAPPAAPAARDNVTAKLNQALVAYLSAAPGSRTELGHQLRDVALATGQSDLTPVAVAVERLAVDGGETDPEAIALANALLTPEVAQVVAHRLGAASRDEELRERRIRAVSRLGDSMITALGAALTEATERGPRRTYIDGMIAIGNRALPVAEAMTLDTRWFVVRNAMRVLREVAKERAVPHFTAALAHDDARVRREALLSLAYVRGDDAAMLVPTKIADPDPEVRQAAAMACGELKAERAVRPMLEQLEKEEDIEVQTAILLSLGQIGDPGAVLAIEKRAETGFFGRKAPTQVRVAAYRALAAIGTPHAKKLVEAAAEDRDPDVRMAVARFPAARVASPGAGSPPEASS